MTPQSLSVMNTTASRPGNPMPPVELDAFPIPPKLRPEIGKSTQFVTICHYFGKFPMSKGDLQRKDLAVRGGFEPESGRFYAAICGGLLCWESLLRLLAAEMSCHYLPRFFIGTTFAGCFGIMPNHAAPSSGWTASA